MSLTSCLLKCGEMSRRFAAALNFAVNRKKAVVLHSLASIGGEAEMLSSSKLLVCVTPEQHFLACWNSSKAGRYIVTFYIDCFRSFNWALVESGHLLGRNKFSKCHRTQFPAAVHRLSSGPSLLS